MKKVAITHVINLLVRDPSIILQDVVIFCTGSSNKFLHDRLDS
jgi:hypothetical protein